MNEFEQSFIRSQWLYKLQKRKYKLVKEPWLPDPENGSAKG